METTIINDDKKYTLFVTVINKKEAGKASK
jgi:hypothetical protein